MRLAPLAILLVPAAGERVDFRYTNSPDQEIVFVRMRYATPYGEPSAMIRPPDRPPSGFLTPA
jgi:hypothetical protein